MTYTLDECGGRVPTQAAGRTADDRPFYFRARHGEWTLQLGEPGWPTDYLDWPDLPGWDPLRDPLPYGVASGVDESRGYMTEAEVRAVLDAHLTA